MRPVFVSFFWAFFASATLAEPIIVTVDQISDPLSTSATGMFRFDPSFVHLPDGGEIQFRNTVGGHTVHSMKGLWPEGVPTVAISGRKVASHQFIQPGLYGITCRRHGDYGMVMVVVVGDRPGKTELLSHIESAPIPRAAKTHFDGLIENSE